MKESVHSVVDVVVRVSISEREHLGKRSSEFYGS